MKDWARNVADRYVARDGSDLGQRSAKQELTRAAVFAAKGHLLTCGHNVAERDVHAALLAAVRAAPEIFEKGSR